MNFNKESVIKVLLVWFLLLILISSMYNSLTGKPVGLYSLIYSHPFFSSPNNTIEKDNFPHQLFILDNSFISRRGSIYSIDVLVPKEASLKPLRISFLNDANKTYLTAKLSLQQKKLCFTTEGISPELIKPTHDSFQLFHEIDTDRYDIYSTYSLSYEKLHTLNSDENASLSLTVHSDTEKYVLQNYTVDYGCLHGQE